MLIEENWTISCLLPLLPPLQCPDFTCAVQLWATMQWWAHFWYQSCVFLQLEFSVSVFILFLILSLTVLFFSLLSYPFISLLMPLLPPQTTALCFLGTRRKARNALKGVPTAFSATVVPGMGGTAQSLAEPPHSLECMWMFWGRGGMYRTSELCPVCRVMRNKNLDPWSGKTWVVLL